MTNGKDRGFVLWFTGMSGAGKSTLSSLLTAELARIRPVELLDGDEARKSLSEGLSFSKEDRDRNVRRIGYVARLLARHGVAAVVAAISPYQATRQEVRELVTGEGLSFIEVYVQAELSALVDRDVKGLYRRALAGEIPHFTGVSDPYEPPPQPEVVVRTDREAVSDSAARIWTTLAERGLVPTTRARHPLTTEP
jgi:adenylylsulfate kinase